VTQGQKFVIVGASVAGATAAAELRMRGFEGRVALIGAEREIPYERPPLSKAYLLGKAARESAFVREPDFYDTHDIELNLDTRVTSIDAGAGRVTLDNDSELEFDRLLLATGAEPRRLRIPGAELAGVHYLRTLTDSDALRERFGAGGHVAVVGSGWIGSEVAACARQDGLEVTMLDPHKLPNERIFGREIGEFYRDVHAAHGVDLMLGEEVESFEGTASVQRVRTASGQVVECDFVVAGIGVIPRTELAKSAGLELCNGVAVDAHLASSAPNVYAAGDVADAWHPVYKQRIRVEHWYNALHQGPVAARGMVGDATEYDRIPYFFSDQYDVSMEYSGYTTDWDEVVFRGDRSGGEFVAFWMKDRRVVAGMNVNVWDVNEQVQALIRSRQQIDTTILRDSDVPLDSLVGEPAASG
jgi:3-phenylpropionate/trans-cinnamate dioxygenase ferredoxin reductase component